MSKLQQMMEEFRDEAIRAFSLDPDHLSYKWWTNLPLEPDTLDYFRQAVWTAQQQWTKNFGPEWASFLIDECPEMIDTEFHYVPDKQWLRETLRGHHELLIPFINEVNMSLADLMTEKMKEELNAHNARLIEHRAVLRNTHSPK